MAERIIDGVLYESQTVPGAWDVSTWESNGHMERSARAAVTWVEVGPAPGYMLAKTTSWPDYIAAATTEEERESRITAYKKELADKENDNRKKSAQRAKTMCRRVIKCENFNELLTLTYRENQLDRELCKKHFKEWVRRMKRALGGYVEWVDPVSGEVVRRWKDGDFRYCGSFERQARGSMHVHIATHKLPAHVEYQGVKIEAWKLGTRVWRSIVGDDNGLCFVGGKSRFGGPRRDRMSQAKMAAYVSKYILKDFEDAPSESNRYSRSNSRPDTRVAKPYKMTFTGVGNVWDLLMLAFECRDGDVVVSHRADKDGQAYWLVTEPLNRPAHTAKT